MKQQTSQHSLMSTTLIEAFSSTQFITKQWNGS